MARRRRIPGWLTLGELVPTNEPRRIRGPEHELLRALLKDALHTILLPPARRQSRRARRLIAEDRAWFCGANARVSFAFVCAQLDLDPGYVRRLIGRELRLMGGVV